MSEARCAGSRTWHKAPHLSYPHPILLTREEVHVQGGRHEHHSQVGLAGQQVTNLQQQPGQQPLPLRHSTKRQQGRSQHTRRGGTGPPKELTAAASCAAPAGTSRTERLPPFPGRGQPPRPHQDEQEVGKAVALVDLVHHLAAGVEGGARDAGWVVAVAVQVCACAYARGGGWGDAGAVGCESCCGRCARTGTPPSLSPCPKGLQPRPAAAAPQGHRGLTRCVTCASGSRATPVSMRSSTPLVQNMREEEGPPRDSRRMLYPTFSPVDSPRSAATRSATAGWVAGVCWW